MQQYDDETIIVCISPAFFWDGKFQEIKLKMEESIGKLSKMVIATSLGLVRVNVCFMYNLCFGCKHLDLIDA